MVSQVWSDHLHHRPGFVRRIIALVQFIQREFVQMILDQLPINADGIHGVLHWARVLHNGRYICQHTKARRDVVEYFALLHDSRRFSNGGDFFHGPRGRSIRV